MAQNQVMPNGDTFSMLAAPTALTSGQGVVVGATFGVSETTCNQGDPATISVRGVYRLPKNNTQAIAPGVKVYWDGAQITTTASGNTLAGKAWNNVATATTDTSVNVNLNLGG